MHNRVFLSIGSNQHPQANINKGVKLLQKLSPHCICSDIVQSRAVGFKGNDFLNAAVAITTSLSLFELQIALKKFEIQCGLVSNQQGEKNKNLDIDILCFNNWHGLYFGIQLPRQEVFINAHVLGPLTQIAPNYILPSQKKTCLQLWKQYPHQSRIRRI